MTPPFTRTPFAVALALFLSTLPLAGCDREDQADVDRTLDEASEKVDAAVEKAEPAVQEGLRDAGEAVGKGLEAAGEVVQQGGENLQEEARDTTETTLPDTVSDSTMVLE